MLVLGVELRDLLRVQILQELGVITLQQKIWNKYQSILTQKDDVAYLSETL